MLVYRYSADTRGGIFHCCIRLPRRAVVSTLICLYVSLSACAPALTRTAPAMSPGSLKMAILTADTPDFLTRWTDEPTVELPTEDQAKRVVAGQTFHAAFIVTGLTANDQGRYDCAVSWKFLRPDTSVLFEQGDFARATGVLPKQPLWSLLDPAVDLKLDATDPPGRYRLVAEVLDRVTSGRATAATVIELWR